MVGTLLRPSSHLSRGSLDSTHQSEAGCLPLLRTHPRYFRLNRISPEANGSARADMKATGGKNVRMASKDARLDRPECPRAWVVEASKQATARP